jgi:putative ABC transport system permease protein
MRATLRRLNKRPGFTALACCTLGVGIAAITIVFSLVYGILLSPLPYADPGRLAFLWEYDRTNSSRPGAALGVADTVLVPDFFEWKQQTHAFQQLEASTIAFFTITSGAQPTVVMGQRVTPGLFSMLGVRPYRGRLMSPQDPEDVALLSYRVWQGQFAGDDSIIGRPVTLSEKKYTVIGILPPEFFFYIRDFELWTPLVFSPQQRSNRQGRPVMAVGRLAPRAAFGQAQAELNTMAARLEKEYPASNKNRNAEITPIRDQYSRFLRPALRVLLGAVAFLLLIACANVASLLLARASEREREIAVRTALGATRWRIVRLLAGESIAIGLAGGAIGASLALFAIPLVRALLPLQLPIPMPGLENISVNAPVLLFAFTLSLVTAILVGAAPGWISSTAALGSSRASMGKRRSRLLNGLIVSEIALTVLLLTGAGLMVKTAWRLTHQDLGFRADHVLEFRTPLSRDTPPDRRARFFAEVIDRVGRVPGVRSAAAGYAMPIGGVGGYSRVSAEGSSVPASVAPSTGTNVVSPAYFRTMSIPLFAGRDFDDRDRANSGEVAIVTSSLVRKLFGDRDAIGERVRLEGDGDPAGKWLTIVGVAGEVRPWVNSQPEAMLYRPMAQATPGSIGYVLRTNADPLKLADSIRSAVWTLDKKQPVTYVSTFEADMRNQSYVQRLNAIGFGWFSGLGLFLAAVGIYSLIFYRVRQSVSEIGIRMAVGARPGDMVRMMVRRGMRLVFAGLSIGTIGAALVATRLLKSLLYEVEPLDLTAFLIAAAVLICTGLLASYLPARQAAAVDPTIALRSE